jgi:hypothetical protein
VTTPARLVASADAVEKIMASRSSGKVRGKIVMQGLRQKE